MPKKQFYSYRGNRIEVRYEPRRCIHAEECIRGAPGVFERNRRPWIDPDREETDRVAEVVLRCPTGALHFERLDGGAPEGRPTTNSARIAADGPIYLEGKLSLELGDGGRREESRMAVCRCGASQNKPFCDGSHRPLGFRDAGDLGEATLTPASDRVIGGLDLWTVPNGPLLFEGRLEIRSAKGGEQHVGGKGALCRCGASSNRPYCDGSHKLVGFQTE